MISVVIPVADQSHRLKKCLHHLLAQQDAEFEVILIDDASTDDSLSLARTLLADHPRTHIVEHDHKKGLWQTRREGIAMAQGSTLLFLDPREWLEPGTLKRLSDTFEAFGVDLVQMHRQRDVSGVPLKIASHPEAVYWQTFTGDDYRRLSRFVGNGSCITPFCGDKLYRTSLLREAARIDYPGGWGEVQVLNINYLRMARSLVLTDFAGVNADWTLDYFTFKFSRLTDYKRLHSIKRCLCSDTEAVDKELCDSLRDHISQLLGEMAWTPEAVAYFVGRELSNPVWQQAGVDVDIQGLIAQQQSALRRRRIRFMLKRLIR